MNKALIGLAAMVLLVLLSGCPETKLYKGIPGAEVPMECAEFADDTCGLYACMTAQCWCDQGYPGPVLVEGSTVIGSEEQAMQAVRNYILDTGPKYEVVYADVQRAVKNNNIFYTVFADLQGEEIVFTVAVDGTIFQTICGV